MEPKVIYVPTINDSPADFAMLIHIMDQVGSDTANVRFDFSNCKFLRPNAVAFLGGLTRLIEFRMGSFEFDWSSCTAPAVMTNLSQNGFMGTFNHPLPSWKGESIPYREDISLDMNGIMDYLADAWLGRGWVNISQKLKDAIVGKVWEIYNNAFEHSRTEIGVFSCGQHYRHYNELILSVVDFGEGIPVNVRSFLQKHVEEGLVAKISGANCLEWAFERGNSTCPQGIARGLGLDLLKEFVTLNEGKLEIYSNEGYVIIDKNGERYENRNISFKGTIVHITLRCDERLYHFKNEV